MLGYWQHPDASRAALRADLLHTGDIGHVDSEGRLHVADRRSDVINRGGANVYPAEVERVLLEDDRVVACAVVGRPNEASWPGGRGVPRAHERRDPRRRCRSRALSGEPGPVQGPARFVQVTAWPRNAMGKIVRAALSER